MLKNSSSTRLRLSWLCVGGAILLASLPIFFEIYREAAFNSVPRDDYAPYLLALVRAGGEVPGSPYVYRILSVAAGIPFYYLLPVYSFTNLPATNQLYLKATEALSMVSYLSILATAGILFLIARKKYRASVLSAILAGFLSLLLSYSISRTGMDPIALLGISLLLYFLDRPVIFAILVLISAAFNEKIPYIFTILTLGRWGWSRLRNKPPSTAGMGAPLLFSMLALAGYFVARALFKFPGFENEANLGAFLPTLVSTLSYIFSLKGAVLNLIPIAIPLMLAVMAIVISRQSASARAHFSATDVACLVFVFALAMVTDLKFTVGRVVMYCYPLYLPLLAVFFDQTLGERPSLPAQGA